MSQTSRADMHARARHLAETLVWPEEAAEMVEIIRALGPSDYEVGHSLEDDLRRRVLEVIASDDTDNARELAQIALTTQGILFARFCA